MARVFDSASSEYLSLSTAVVSGSPCTLCCWFYPTNTSIEEVMSVSDLSNDDNYIRLFHGLGIIAFEIGDSSGTPQLLGPSITTNAWNFVAGIFESATSMSVYANGTFSNSTITSVSPTGLDTTAIGALRRPSALYGTGRFAEAAIYDIALTEAQLDEIYGSAISPLLFRPDALQMYSKLIRDEDVDLMGNGSFTVGGTPTIEQHPHIIYPQDPMIYYDETAVVASGGLQRGGLMSIGVGA